MVNGQKLTGQTLASRLRVEVTADSPTFDGDPNNKTVQNGAAPIQANSVFHCVPSCEVHVIFHDAFGSVPTLDAFSGVLADGDYTVKLFRDGSTLVGSKAIAINHPDVGGTNGTFLDETQQDQVVTFYLNQNLQQIQTPTVDVPHTRASTHLTASITSPSGSAITIGMCDTLRAIGSGQNGIGGTKKFAWDWNATGGSTETFDTEFSTSTLGKKVYGSPGDGKFRLLVRDGKDGISPFFGGHYAVTPTKTVHVTGDCARAAGNTIPRSMSAGSINLVGMIMDNEGTTTWSSASGYRLELWRDGVWTPLSVPLSSNVSPGGTHSFIFNLKAPSPGTYAVLYRMYHLGVTNFFGDANGWNSVTVTSGGGGGFSASELEPVTAEIGVDPAKWTSAAASSESGPLILDKASLAGSRVAILEYNYSLPITAGIDVALRFAYDPLVLTPAVMREGTGSASLTRLAGLAKPGEYWVRLTGTIRGGSGEILQFPFILAPGAEIPDSLGSLALYSLGP